MKHSSSLVGWCAGSLTAALRRVQAVLANYSLAAEEKRAEQSRAEQRREEQQRREQQNREETRKRDQMMGSAHAHTPPNQFSDSVCQFRTAKLEIITTILAWFA